MLRAVAARDRRGRCTCCWTGSSSSSSTSSGPGELVATPRMPRAVSASSSSPMSSPPRPRPPVIGRRLVLPLPLPPWSSISESSLNAPLAIPLMPSSSSWATWSRSELGSSDSAARVRRDEDAEDALAATGGEEYASVGGWAGISLLFFFSFLVFWFDLGGSIYEREGERERS
ncbi:hypothetical protein BC828DRAFT_378546 [Blastocladiella britannica]|nr:hypothetical protein BC828DRAFT_378546 [Blastocladiella britannica]